MVDEGGQGNSLGRWKNGTCVLRSEGEQIRSEDQNFSEKFIRQILAEEIACAKALRWKGACHLAGTESSYCGYWNEKSLR